MARPLPLVQPADGAVTRVGLEAYHPTHADLAALRPDHRHHHRLVSRGRAPRIRHPPTAGTLGDRERRLCPRVR
jgi:hypothetical protein